MLINILTILYLTAESLVDIRKREFSLRMTLIYVSLVLFVLSAAKTPPAGRILSMGCGGGAALISLVSGEALGMGDAIVITALGLAYPLLPLLSILCASSVVCAFFCLALTVKKKKDVLEAGIPFVPFLLAGALCHLAF